jgi:hypothetical protein
MALRLLYWRAVSVPAWKDDSDSDRSSTIRGDGESLDGSNETARPCALFSLPVSFDSTDAVVVTGSASSVGGEDGAKLIGAV